MLNWKGRKFCRVCNQFQRSSVIWSAAGAEVGNVESKGHAQPQCKGHLGPVCGERLGSETLYPQASSKEPDEAGREDQMHPEAEENANKARIEAERRTVAGAKEAKRPAAQEVLLEADKAKKEAEAAAQAMEEAKVKEAEELRAKAEAEKAARQANRPVCRPECMLPAPARPVFQQGMPRVGGVFPASIRQLVGWFQQCGREQPCHHQRLPRLCTNIHPLGRFCSSQALPAVWCSCVRAIRL